MAESEARYWVLVWVEDLRQRAGSKRFWEEEQERIDLRTCPSSVIRIISYTSFLITSLNLNVFKKKN